MSVSRNFLFKPFVREVGEVAVERSVKERVECFLSGEEAKKFYDEVTCADDLKTVTTASPMSKLRKRRIKRRSNETIELLDEKKLLNRFLVAAENNDIHDLSDIIKKNVHIINQTDQHGWTALMCSACSGAIDAVKFLVSKGANTHIKDKSGSNATLIAMKRKHTDIVSILKTETYKRQKNRSANQDSIKDQQYYCLDCKQNFHCSKEEHSTSTLHLFSTKSGGIPTLYGIPESNKGFQILLKNGWDKEHGLGPNGTGKKFPLKVNLKSDRRGIGEEPAPKQDMERRNTRTVNKRKKIRSDKYFEKKFRSEFYG